MGNRYDRGRSQEFSRRPPDDLMAVSGSDHSPLGMSWFGNSRFFATHPRTVPHPLKEQSAGHLSTFSMLHFPQRRPCRLPSLRVPWVLVLAWAFIAFLTTGPAAQAQGLVISEFLSANLGPLLDMDGDDSDWIEIHNPTTAPISLAGWALTDDPMRVLVWMFPARVMQPDERLIVFASGKNLAPLVGELHTNFRLDVDGEDLALLDPTGTVASTYGSPFPKQRGRVSFGTGMTGNYLVLGEGAGCRALVPSAAVNPTGWQNLGFSAVGWPSGSTGVGFDSTGQFSPFIGLDVQSSMLGNTGSCYIRVPFSVANPSTFDGMVLRMRYDAGFVAYLNGTQIQAVNAPTTLTWNSTATQGRDPYEAVKWVEFDVSSHLGLLQAGSNMLAIHALNESASDPQFLVSPGFAGAINSPTPLYFDRPTPGARNLIGFLDFAEAVSADEPPGIREGDLYVTLTTATPGAVIVYTTDGSTPSDANGSIYLSPIHIDRSTALRAVALRTDLAPSKVNTWSYLFVNTVPTQSNVQPGLPATWGTHATHGVHAPPTPTFTAIADYEVDPTVTTSEKLQAALRALPVVSLAIDPREMFDENIGIYSHPEDRTIEYPASMEFLDPEQGISYQRNCALRIHGSGSRLPWLASKHSFRVRFDARFGPEHWNQPIFGPGTALSYKTIVLKAGFNDSWAINLGSADFAVYWRDQVLRDLQRKMGHASSNSNWAHLYVNGLYWGLYQPMERPDDLFAAHYHGGNHDEYDVIKHRAPDLVAGNLQSWNTLYSLAGPSSTAYTAIKNYLDVDNFVDYLLLNFYFGTNDWLPNNWYAARRRVAGAGYKFYSWDAELSFRTDDKTGINAPDSPAYIYDQLKGNADFRLDFADRVYRHCFNDGALTNQSILEVLGKHAQIVESAIVAESARWGDWNGVDMYTREDHYVPSVMGYQLFVLSRLSTLLSQLQAAGLYPTIDPPLFNQNGGHVTPGFMLTMTPPQSGSILFTLDGSDPRMSGGAVSPTAVTYTGPISLSPLGATVRARMLSGGTWSAMAEASFVGESIVISELMANNDSTIADGAGDFDDWIELHNPTTTMVDISGYYLTDDPSNTTKWAIPAGTTMTAGSYLLIWADGEPQEGPLHTNFGLSSNGESLALYMPDGLTAVDAHVFGVQVADISEGRFPLPTDVFRGLLTPTPGTVNDPSCGSTAFIEGPASQYPLTLLASAPASLGTVMTLDCAGPFPSVPHLYGIGAASAATPILGVQGQLLIEPPVALLGGLLSSPTGSTVFPIAIPNIPALVGFSFTLQVLADANGTVAFSNGLKLTICP